MAFVRRIAFIVMGLMAAACVVCCAQPPPNLQLFLLIGQSNMTGRGTVGPEDRAPIPGVYMLTQDLTWVPAVDPMSFDDRLTAVGPGRSFARTLKAANPLLSIGLIPAAVGGTTLEMWKPGGKLYENALQRAQVAMKSGTLRGILWHQGEGDSTLYADVLTYGLRWQHFIDCLRADLKLPDVPVVVGELCRSQYIRPDGRIPFAHQINEQLALLPLFVDHCAFVSSAGLIDNGSYAHFSTASQHEFGRRYALAFMSLDSTWWRAAAPSDVGARQTPADLPAAAASP